MFLICNIYQSFKFLFDLTFPAHYNTYMEKFKSLSYKNKNTKGKTLFEKPTILENVFNFTYFPF